MMKIKRILIYLFAFPFCVNHAAAADVSAEWQVKDAPVRFVAELVREPTHDSAGYFLRIPDGGVLPGPRPESVVFDESGEPLESAILWYNKNTFCSLVFQAPAAGSTAIIYFRSGKRMNLWTPETGITPSALLCETPGSRKKSAAQKMSDLGPMSSQSRFVNQGWNCGEWDGKPIPLATWEWRMGGNAAYILAYIDVDAPGPTWIAPQIRRGNMDIHIDGKTVKLKKKNEKLGGIGGTVNLSRGLHRVEMFCYNAKSRGGQAHPTGPMMFTWRTPETTVEELGGPRSEDLRYPGTPMCESCIIDFERIVKSGECRIRSASSQSGPVAVFQYEPKDVFWLDGEVPLLACAFKARTSGNPDETRYTWRFEQNKEALAEGADMSWLLQAGRFTEVTLVAEAGRKRSVATCLIYPHTDIESSMDDPETRFNFKLACYNMLKAFPENKDPTADWGPSMWNNFFRVLDLNTGNLLLEYLVTERWDFIKSKLSPERKTLIQDIFLFSMTLKDPEDALKWVAKFAGREFSAGRSAVLKLKQAEIFMYYLDNPDRARKIITPLLRRSGEASEWAGIRMGDLEMLCGNLNKAIQRYGDVQSRSKGLSEEMVPKTLSSLTPASKKRLSEMKEPAVNIMAKELNSKKWERRANRNENSVTDDFVPMTEPADVPAWKLAAIRDVAASENIDVLIDQGFFLEAYRALQLWERALPMSKINGDYILREAQLHMALKDYKKARKSLSAYCEQVDVSNFLPEAMSMIKRCMIEMNESDAAIEKYVKEVMNRTAFGVNEDN
ncbi:MAG: hypothetical protein R6V06_09755 [Kiritimatiellia bacterium]